MLSTLERNCERYGITLNGIGSGRQGIVHVIAPELGLTQSGMTVFAVTRTPPPMAPSVRLPLGSAPAR